MLYHTVSKMPLLRGLVTIVRVSYTLFKCNLTPRMLRYYKTISLIIFLYAALLILCGFFKEVRYRFVNFLLSLLITYENGLYGKNCIFFKVNEEKNNFSVLVI